MGTIWLKYRSVSICPIFSIHSLLSQFYYSLEQGDGEELCDLYQVYFS